MIPMNGWLVTKDMGNQAMNWLPAPEGDCRLVARFYGPKAPLIDGTYPMPRPVQV